MSFGFRNAVAATLLGSGLFLAQPASATIVRVQTNLGDFDINLFDNATPKTVANFLAYVNANAYATNVVYRSEPGFVVQAGGYRYPGSLPLVAVAENPKVANEPVYSNVRGTIAMAKIATDPNSATNQWFINLGDNSANLDTQNGGFTAFGQVIGNGMTVVDAIAALTRFNMGGNFTAVPLRNYTAADATAGVTVTDNNLVLISNIIVIDSSASSAASLTPVPNTRINAPSGGGGGGGGGDSGGGGTFGLAGLFALGMLVLGRRVLARAPRA